MRQVLFTLVLAAACAAAAPAKAQLSGLPVPTTPALPDVLSNTRDLAEDSLGSLEETRRRAIRNLLRTNRRTLEADPAGNPIVRSQILSVNPSEAALAQAQAQGFEVTRTDALALDVDVVTLRAPARMSTRRALRRLREGDPTGVYDFDHLHFEAGALAATAMGQTGASGAGPRVGLIDSGVEGPVAAQRGFASDAPVAAQHGTAVARLIGETAPGARIYAADIYGGAPTGGASSTLARALDWLAQETVPVINVSLVGPRNRVIEAVVRRLIDRGFVIVASVGNDGPAAAPLFPASYEGVVGVTGVDSRRRVLIEAGRGPQVDFAALGVHGRTRGTSFASPIVAARLAQALARPDPGAANGAIEALSAHAHDLGARGRDDIYGYGLISGPN